MRKVNIYLLIVAFIYVHYGAFSQYKDFESWIDIGIEKELNEKLSLKIEESIRFNQNSGALKSFNSDLGIAYKFNKFFELGVDYRISQKNKPTGYYFGHRGNVDFNIKKKYNQFKIAYRNRSQLEKGNYINEQADLYAQAENRNRLKISYNIRGIKTDPFFSIELFHELNQINFYRINATRLYFGFSRKLPSKIKLNLAFIYKHIYKDAIENIYILNASLKKSF